MSYGVGSVVGPIWGGVLVNSLGWRGLCVSFVALNAGSACLVHEFFGGQTR
jgi:predicted MFS family arabinose efflux permease